MHAGPGVRFGLGGKACPAVGSERRRKAGTCERLFLLAMHPTLVECGFCLRQPADKGSLLWSHDDGHHGA